MQNTSVKGVQKPVPHYMPSMRARTPTPLKEEFCTPHSRNREVRHALTHSAGRGQHNGERPNGDRCKGDARRIPAITFTVANWGDGDAASFGFCVLFPAERRVHSADSRVYA